MRSRLATEDGILRRSAERMHELTAIRPNTEIPIDMGSSERAKALKHAQRRRAPKVVVAAALLSGLAFLGTRIDSEVQAIDHADNPVTVPYRSSVPFRDYRPVGIQSVGVVNGESEVVSVKTRSLVGYAKIDTLNVSKDLTENGKNTIAGQHVASLQLNATWIAESESPGKHGHPITVYNVFFIQNAAVFNTANSTVSFLDSIYKIGTYTYAGSGHIKELNSGSLRSEVLGSGQVSGHYYTSETRPYGYSNGTSIYMSISSSTTSGSAYLHFNYAYGRDPKDDKLETFDSPRLTGLGRVSSAAIVITPTSDVREVPAQLVLAGLNSGIAVFDRTDVPFMALYFESGRKYYPLTVTSAGSNGYTVERAYGIRTISSPPYDHAAVEG